MGSEQKAAEKKINEGVCKASVSLAESIPYAVTLTTTLLCINRGGRE